MQNSAYFTTLTFLFKSIGGFVKKVLTFSTKFLKFFFISFSILLILFFLILALNFRPKSSKKMSSRSSAFDIAQVEEKVEHFPPATLEPTQMENFNLFGVLSFKNLSLHKNIFYIAEQSPSIDVDTILDPNESYHYQFENCDIKAFEQHQDKLITKRIPGTTFIFSSTDEFNRFQGHYYHFCEEFLLAWCAHKHQETPPISTVVFPNIEKWKGKFNDINDKIIQSTASGASVIPASTLKLLSKKYLLQFENAIFVDRRACHRNQQVAAYNQMTLAHKPILKREYITEFKNHLLDAFKTYPRAVEKPFITYIRRNTYRYLEPGFEKKLLTDLQEQFPDYQLNPVWFENYSFPEQLQIIRNSKVLIGAHGNGLTHELFLPEKSLVVEIFPREAFTMDYLYFSELAGHIYFGLDPDKGVIAQTGSRIAHHGDLNQVIPEFDTEKVTCLLKNYFSSDKVGTLNERSLEE